MLRSQTRLIYADTGTGIPSLVPAANHAKVLGYELVIGPISVLYQRKFYIYRDYIMHKQSTAESDPGLALMTLKIWNFSVMEKAVKMLINVCIHSRHR